MGKPRKLEIKCSCCGDMAIKTVSAINAAINAGKPLYCSYACSNKARTQVIEIQCKWCKKMFTPKYTNKRSFCTEQCSGLYFSNKQYIEYIERWKSGLETGRINKNGTAISGHLRKYLFSKHNNKCCECGWSKIHPVTGRIPLEIDHKDGDWKNNIEDNLRLVCPNCHSLSSNFRSLNKGKGRTNSVSLQAGSVCIEHSTSNPVLNCGGSGDLPTGI